MGPQCVRMANSITQVLKAPDSVTSDLWRLLGVCTKDIEATRVQEALFPGHAQYFSSIVPFMPGSLSLFLSHPPPLPFVDWLLHKLWSSLAGLREDN